MQISSQDEAASHRDRPGCAVIRGDSPVRGQHRDADVLPVHPRRDGGVPQSHLFASTGECGSPSASSAVKLSAVHAVEILDSRGGPISGFGDGLGAPTDALRVLAETVASQVTSGGADRSGRA